MHTGRDGIEHFSETFPLGRRLIDSKWLVNPVECLVGSTYIGWQGALPVGSFPLQDLQHCHAIAAFMSWCLSHAAVSICGGQRRMLLAIYERGCALK